MKRTKQTMILGVLALLYLPLLAFSQETKAEERGYIDFGVRHVWGEVYGRPDLLPYEPAIETSKYNEYRDIRDGAFIRSMRVRLLDVLGSRNYLSLQSAKSFYHDQSYLATIGQYGRFAVQFRWDQIPHTYSNTTRTLFSESTAGVYTLPLALRTQLQNFPNNSVNLPSFIATSLVQPLNPLIVPSITRKAGTGSASWNVTSGWNLNFLFSRENEVGTRPIGLILNSGPSASLTGGYGVELPEPIDYFTDNLKIGAEYARNTWAVQFGYAGSWFQNNISTLVFDNPFRTTDCVQPAGCISATQGAATGRMDLYPNNHAQYLNFAGGVDLGRYARVMASISPGWLRQNDLFVPYTTNTALNLCGSSGTDPCSSLAVLPVPSLGGEKQTLAMNFTGVAKPIRNVQLKAMYRHYDYNNDTLVREFTPVIGDIAAPFSEDTGSHTTSFHKKTVELTGSWFFAKRSTVKVGYEGEWFDRERRDVAHSRENTVLAAVDYSPVKDLLFRVSYRHSNREPDLYEDEASEGVECEAGALAAARAAFEFPEIQPCTRRFDESARLRDRAEGLVKYSPFDKLSFSLFASTVQDDYNRPGGTNSATPLNFLTGSAATTSSYYLYGVLKDLSYNYGFDVDFAVTPWATLFGEYSHERYHKRMVTRYRAPQQGATGASNGCGPNSFGTANRGPCDSANNDWESTARELVDIWTAGVDFNAGKKIFASTFYSLSAPQGHVTSRFLGDPVGHPNTPLANDIDRFLLVGTNAAVDYPSTVSRIHDLTAIFKYKINKNFMPRLEYRYQQFDNHDYQTTPMTQYMGCVSPAPPGAAVPGCTIPILNDAFSPTPVPSPNLLFPNQYPYFVVGDTSAARYLFLGTDQPSYRAHYFAATLEYHF